MLEFDDIKEKVSDFFYEKPLLARILLLVIVLFLIGIIVLFIQATPPKTKTYEKTQIILEGAPDSPSGPDIEKEYYQTRNTENTWSEEETKKYFSVPDGKMLKGLETANDKIVSDITGSAP